MPLKTDAVLFRESLLRQLEASAAPDEALERTVESARRTGLPVHSILFSILAQHEFSEAEARRHWRRVREHRALLEEAVGRDVGLRVAMFDYLVNVSRTLRNPIMVEIGTYQTTARSAVTDGLTGLHNHAYFVAALRREVQRGRRLGGQISVAMLDLDNFKALNDTRGHVEGDRVLVEAAELVRAALREIDIAARYGGEEFAVVLPDTPRAGALVVAERIRDRVERHFADHDPPVTISGGVSSFPEDAIDHEELVRRADAGLYRAKAEGRNRVVFARDDRRSHPRFPLDATARVAAGRMRARGHACNASLTGLLLGLPRGVPVGRRLIITVEPDGGEPIVLRGLVVRDNPGANGEHMVGIRLLTPLESTPLGKALPRAS